MSWREIKKFKKISGAFAAGFVLAAGGMLGAYLALRRISQPLILHYNGQNGISQIGRVGDLMFFGGSALVMLALNFFIALALEERGIFWGKIAAASSLILAVLIFTGFMAIIAVN